MRVRSIALTLMASGFMLAHVGSAHAAYEFSPLWKLEGGPGGTTMANAINNVGQVAGYSSNAEGNMRPVVFNVSNPLPMAYAPNTTVGVVYGMNNVGQAVGGYGGNQGAVWDIATGTATTILSAAPGVTTGFVYATGINDSGKVVGVSADYSTGKVKAVVWNGSTATVLSAPTLPGLVPTSSMAVGINNAGTIIGNVRSVDNMQALRWDGGAYTRLNPLTSGGSTVASAINTAGQVAGYSFTGEYAHSPSTAVVWNGSTATSLATLSGYAGAEALAMNNMGQVVGQTVTVEGYSGVAVLWNGTTAVDLNSFLTQDLIDAGWVLYSATGINDAGWIVGSAYNTKGNYGLAYELSVNAIPEPTTTALMGLGLAALGLVVRRQRKA